MDLNGKTCALTGATGGIGESIAHNLAQAGAKLVLVSRRGDRLESMLARMPGAGHSAVVADLTSSVGIRAVATACNGVVDILVNNAGVNHFGLFAMQDDDLLRQMMEVNALAPMLLTRALLPSMIERQGTIVFIGSGFGSIGFAGYCGYSASKFAVRGFAEALRRELSDTAVKVLYLSPRATATDMNSAAVVAMNDELGNSIDPPQRVADELIKQLHTSQRERFIGWPERFFVRLNGLFPGLVDGALGKQLPAIKRWALASGGKAG